MERMGNQKISNNLFKYNPGDKRDQDRLQKRWKVQLLM